MVNHDEQRPTPPPEDGLPAAPLPGTVATPLIERPARSAKPTVPVLRVIGGRDVLRFAVLTMGSTVEIGREDTCALVLTDPSVSRRHAVVKTDREGYLLEDLGSRNGTRVDEEPVKRALLTPGDRVEVGTVLLRFEMLTAEELDHLQGVLQRLETSDRDPLTGLMTRGWIDERLPQLFAEAQAAGRPMSAVFIDVDRFKAVNDTYGHGVGDDVLRQVARLIAWGTRLREGCVRYGGEELLVVLGDTGEPHAAVVADRLRQQVESYDWLRVGDGLRVTISCGVAQALEGESVRAWLDRADKAVYTAKQAGRNRVWRASQP